MIIKIHIKECLGCENCVNICPQIFSIDLLKEKCKINMNPPYSQNIQKLIKIAAEECPVLAIEIKE